MVFQNLSQPEAEAVWRPFFDWVRVAPQDFEIVIEAAERSRPPDAPSGTPRCCDRFPASSSPTIAPARAEGNIFWAGNQGEAGWFIYAYQSTWLPASLLEADQRGRSSRRWSRRRSTPPWRLHVNKGLAGRPAGGDRRGEGDTAMNPAVDRRLRAGDHRRRGQPAYPGVPGHEPDEAEARRRPPP